MPPYLKLEYTFTMMGEQTNVTDEINGMVRAQSSLELLSATAAVLDKNEGPSNNDDICSTRNDLDPTATNSNHHIVRAPSAVSDLFQLSPYPARVTPAESAVNLLAHSKSTLSLPDMMMLNQHSNRSNSATDFILEQKRSYLPFDTSCAADLDSSPGLFLCYSNASMNSHPRCAVPSATGASNETIISMDPNSAASANKDSCVFTLSPSAGDQPQKQQSSTSATASAFPSVMVTSSFSSGSGISSTSTSSFLPTTSQSNHSNPFSTTTTQAAFAPPRPATLQLLRNESPPNESDLYRENSSLRQQLAVKNATIEALQNQIASLHREIGELRQLPTGKISQIPIEYVQFCL
jgi:hypothetical protein